MICLPCVEVVAAADPELWPIIALAVVSVPIGILYLGYYAMRWLAVSSWDRLERQERSRHQERKNLQARLEREIATAQASVRRMLAIADQSKGRR
jgi:ABC-type anion transport system duplicated permease subunit